MALNAAEAKRARVALHRFGLGPKPGVIEKIGSDPLRVLKAELDRPALALIVDPALPSRVKAARESQEGYWPSENNRQLELKARVAKHLSVDTGFLERLVLFWSNHFSMSSNKDDVIRGTIGQLERDVIRKHVLGNFQNMLRGVMKHPAMLRYLDNQDSIGPASPAGKAWGAGLNENLGRELLELHTVGTGGGYEEEDVTRMAKALTGWSYVRGWEADNGWNGGASATKGQFIFRADWHQPGPMTLMGRRFPHGGIGQAESILTFLARHPSTAQHIAFKLVRHFIADEPTPEMIGPVAEAFGRSAGDLKKTTLALLDLPEAWSAPLHKFRTPYELAVAQHRAMGTTFDEESRWTFVEPLRAMHHLPWERGAPDGFPDESLAWLDPDGMTIRLDTAMLIVDHFGDAVKDSPLKLARSLYGAALSEPLADALTWTYDRRAALTLLFMSPEFQRR